MTTRKPSASVVAFKWAAISLITTIVVTYVWQFLNIGPTSPLRFIGFIPFIVFLFLTQKEYRDQLGGFATFGEEFTAGLLFSVFAGILAAVFIYLYYTMLSPAAFQEYLDAQRVALAAQHLSEDQIEQQMTFINKLGVFLPVAGMLIGSPIAGAIVGLIGAAIFNKKRTLQDIENETPDPAV